MTETKSAWGYVRLSQSGREASLAEQKKSIRDYAADYEELQLETTRNDGDRTSGFNAEREQYQLLREQIRTGGLDAVIVRDRARLSRDFDDRVRLLSEFRTNGVEWHVIEAGGRLHVEDVQNAGIECLHAMMDHVKKQIEIERSREALAERMEKDYDHGRPKFGMQYDEAGQYQVPGDDFDKVVDIIELRDDGASYPEIEDEVGVSISTARRVWERRNWYIERTKHLEAGA